MDRNSTRTDGALDRRTVATTAACLLVVLAGVVPTATAAADQPRTAEEFLGALRGYEEAPALTNYSELEVMRSQAVTAVQSGAFTDADRSRMRALLAVLDEFTAAYRAASNGSRVESLGRANRTAAAVDRLEAAGGEDYAALARLGVERFYRQQGEALYERSRTATNTSAELRSLEAAATAFGASGATDRYSAVSAEASRLRATYESDRRRMREALAAANAFADDCGPACDSPVAAVAGLGPDVFSRYADARAANARSRTAVRLAEKHGNAAAIRRASTAAEATSTALLALSVAGGLLAGAYALLVGLVAGAVAWRIASWADDVDGAKVGRIVPRDTVEVADR